MYARVCELKLHVNLLFYVNENKNPCDCCGNIVSIYMYKLLGTSNFLCACIYENIKFLLLLNSTINAFTLYTQGNT